MKPKGLSPLFTIGLSPNQVVALTGVPGVRGAMKPKPAPDPSGLDDAVVRMKQRGMSARAISKELGLSLSAVYSRLPNLVQ